MTNPQLTSFLKVKSQKAFLLKSEKQDKDVHSHHFYSSQWESQPLQSEKNPNWKRISKTTTVYR